jgi:FKBP-type peptidyl-prolyl cis-trans isomerase FkpA
MNNLLRCAVAMLLALTASHVTAQSEYTDQEKVAYTIGYLVADALMPFSLTAEELDLVVAGMRAKVSGATPPFDPDTQRDQVMALRNERAQAVLAKEKAAGTQFLQKAAAADGAVQTESGLIFQETKAGGGASPTAADTVVVHYTGTLMDGSTFDSSRQRGQPATFPLGGVIPCWTEGLQRMSVGGRAILTCPSDIAYGDRGSPPRIPGGAVLVFDVELLEIVTDQ